MNAIVKHILVPVDFSDKSVYGLQMTADLLKNKGGEVTVLNVLKGVDPVWSDFFSKEEREALLDKLKEHLQNFTERYIDTSKFKVNCVIEKGKLCDTILEKAKEIDASSIVMGTSTVDNIKKRIIGTNALRVVSEAKCPVITLKQKPNSDSIKRIILPLDITKDSREKTTIAVELAKENNAEIFLVSAYTIDDDGILHKLESQQKQVVDFIRGNGVEVTASLLKLNDRVEGVLDFIKKNRGDIILITTHQQLEIVNTFLGSFAQSIIKEANIPVMSIVPKLKHFVVFKLPAS
jgi:nucleotide-binding universal stress UspA family protein